MKINQASEELKNNVLQLLEKTEDKNDAVYQAIDMIVTAQNKELIDQLLEESEKASQDAEYRKSLGLKKLSKEATQFYEKFKDLKQSITADQIDIIPNEIIDRTLDDVRRASNVLKLVTFAPANVKKWIVASKTGTATWVPLTDAIKGELTATVTSLNVELHKLTTYLVIPKAIRELALPFVDKYFTAILGEAMQDGLVLGYLTGDGKNAPIGIFKQIESVNEDGTHKDKDVVNITSFSPKTLAPIRKTLTKDGKRVVPTLYLICNPSDEAEYIDPCLFGESVVGGYVNKSFMPIEKVVDANVPAGKAAFTIGGAYVMGTTGVKLGDYKETMAMDDADVLICKCEANGRPVDDNTAVVIDATKLQEYKLPAMSGFAEAIKALTDAIGTLKVGA